MLLTSKWKGLVRYRNRWNNFNWPLVPGWTIVKTVTPGTSSAQRKKVLLNDYKQLAISNLLQDSAAEKNPCPLCDYEFDSIFHLEMHIRNHCTFLHCLVSHETGKIKQFFQNFSAIFELLISFFWPQFEIVHQHLELVIIINCLQHLSPT